MNSNGIKMSKEELIKFIEQQMPFREYTKAERLEMEQIKTELDLLKWEGWEESD